MTDLSLNYYGGSGGFLALWILLLGSKYRCKFNTPEDLEAIFSRHWAVQDPKQWKNSEVWPSNSLTQNSNSTHKIYYHCNPSEDEWRWDEELGKTRILLYTDFETQIQLSEFKNAFVNCGRTTTDVYPLSPFVNYYNDIKDPAWPEIQSFNDIYKLPTAIYNEVCETLHITETYVEDLLDKDRVMFNGEYVWKDLPEKLKSAEVVVKLQDIVKSNGNALLNKVGSETNDKVQYFISQWLGLHSIDLQKRITGE